MEMKYRIRRRMVSEFLERNPICEACGVWAGFDGAARFVSQKATDVHELVNRSQQGNILDKRIFVAVCRACHSRIGDNVNDAEIVGLHLKSWAYDNAHILEAQRCRDSWRNGVPTQPGWIEDGWTTLSGST